MAEELGRTRHLTVSGNGDVDAAVRDTPDKAGGIGALRDADGDHETTERNTLGTAAVAAVMLLLAP